MKKLLICLLSAMIWLNVSASIRLPAIFGDHMVLQRNKPIRVWGWAGRYEKVTVRLNRQVKTVYADKAGNWKLSLSPEKAGGPYFLSVRGKTNSIRLNHVLIGEVWLCSGQSNMEFTVKAAMDADKETASAIFPEIREFKVPLSLNSMPQKDLNGGKWSVCSPVTAGDFSAVAFFYARQLYKKLKVPVGIINSSWGGTMLETWMSRESLERDPELKEVIDKLPVINLDAMKKFYAISMRNKLLKLQGSLADTSDQNQWKISGYNDAAWPSMSLPDLWDNQELGNFAGVVWFRKEFVLTDTLGRAGAMLSLSMIDEDDSTFVNGVFVGAANGYLKKRKYAFPLSLLKKGTNTISVRIVNQDGAGGIYGLGADLQLALLDTLIKLAGKWKYKVLKVNNRDTALSANSYPSLLYNAMITPLIPYAIRGVLWYQGESNVNRAYQYRKSFPLMISGWRKAWGQGDFPFYYVQLSSFNEFNGNSNAGSKWAELREAQTLAGSVNNSGMVITTDIGNPLNIHPVNKQEVGYRLACMSLNRTYNYQIPFNGPRYISFQKSGSSLIVYFNTGDSEMTIKGDELKGFEVAGEDRKFYQANAIITGGQIKVYSKNVSSPVAVRYAWADAPVSANLYNKLGFPAQPFRTDQWPGVTDTVTYKLNK